MFSSKIDHGSITTLTADYLVDIDETDITIISKECKNCICCFCMDDVCKIESCRDRCYCNKKPLAAQKCPEKNKI